MLRFFFVMKPYNYIPTIVLRVHILIEYALTTR